MRDFGKSDNPAVQAQLDRLARLSLPDGRIDLETVRNLLHRLGNPHRNLPPVFHVAGTNGKGSTCAFLRAMLEADGKRVHATTSPHLVRYNERIRIAGQLIEDADLALILKEVIDIGAHLDPSFFEVTIAASFLAFSRMRAEACIIEVGLGGRFDATNVIEKPAVCGIAALGIDHERFLLAPEEGVPEIPIARIAFEKAGIAKRGVPLVSQSYPAEAEAEIKRAALRQGARALIRGCNWQASSGGALHYSDEQGELTLPLPTIAGPHQADNAALAVAMLRHQDCITVSSEALAQGIRQAAWPARLQRLSPGPLTGQREIWLDGGHNADAGRALARYFAGRKLHLIVGMIENKDPAAILNPLRENLISVTAVPISTHDHHQASAFGHGAADAASLQDALTALPDDGVPVLIAGSLYLAGDVLRLNRELPS